VVSVQVVLKNFFSTETAAVEVAFDPPATGNDRRSTHQPQVIYCNLDDHCVGLFVVGEKLFLYLNGLASEVLEQCATASLHQDGLLHLLKLTVGGSVTTVVYNNPRSPVSTQFYSEEEEDADFGLWLTNVLKSDLRRKTFLDSWRVT
jgi:hypothetical protein